MNYLKIAPPNTFIHDYMKYMSEVETSYSYDFWCAVWAIGAGIGRDTYINRPRTPVYLNWYIILAAESGITRKSTAIRSIIPIVQEDPGINLITAKTTPTGFMQDLADRGERTGLSDAHFAFTELVTILGQESYQRSMVGILTDLYDCPEERKGPGNYAEKLTFRNAYVSFISASTPMWLATDVNPSVIEGGFTSRVVFVVDEKPKRQIAWPKQEDGGLDGVRDRFKEILSTDKGPIGINTKALSRFSSWYRRRSVHADPFLSSFEAREDDHILRLAGCLAVNDGTFEIQNTHITRSIDVISDIKDRASSLFGEGRQVEEQSKLTNHVQLIRKHLVKAGDKGTSHSVLQQKIRNSIPLRDFKLTISVLHELGHITIYETPRGGRYYRANRSIETAGVVEAVLSHSKA